MQTVKVTQAGTCRNPKNDHLVKHTQPFSLLSHAAPPENVMAISRLICSVAGREAPNDDR